MPYLKLFHGRQRPEDRLEDEARPGPIFGPWPYFLSVGGTEIHFDHDACILTLVNDLVYYDGLFYADWSVFEGPPGDEYQHLLTDLRSGEGRCPGRPTHPASACSLVSSTAVCRESWLTLQNGRLPPGSKVERCDQCDRYPGR